MEMDEEERSFAPEAPRMGELSPIDVRQGTVKDALQALQIGIVQTHGCLEQHITEQTKHNAAQLLRDVTATEKREEMSTDLAELKGEVRGLVLALGIQKPQQGEEKPKAQTLASWPAWKLLTFMGGVGIGIPALAKLADAIGPDVWRWLVGLGG